MSASEPGEMLIPGAARGPFLRLAAPLSFWGGVDPLSGKVIQTRHPDCGRSIAGRMLALPGTIGSSSSSAVLLELIRLGKAPAALILAEVDAILLVGALVAREMGWTPPPAVRIGAPRVLALDAPGYTLAEDGRLTAIADWS